MSELKVFKEVSSLPSTLVPNGMYLIRNGTGFDIKVADATGKMAHSLNIGGLTAEQTVALNRFQAAVGSGSSMNIAYVTDVSNINVGEAIETLEIGYYSSASKKGGGTFRKVPSATTLIPGIVISSKDGYKFKREVEGDRYELEMFGYVQGGSDDSDVFFSSMRSVAQHQGRLVLPKTGELFIDASPTSTKFLQPGLKELDGNGCTINLINPTNNEIWLAAGCNGLDIHHVVLRPGKNAARSGGFFGRSNSKIKIRYCDIEAKKNHAIINRIIKNEGDVVCEAWEVHDNVTNVVREVTDARYITGDSAYQNILFDVHKISDTSTSNDMDVLWTQTKAVPDAHGRRHRGHKIYNNYCKGGRYGIAVYFGEGCIVHDNITIDNVRGIVFQDKGSFNKIYDNYVYNYTTGILIAYESTGNEVYNNTLRRLSDWQPTIYGQGHIVCYVQPTRNTIKNNKIFCESARGPNWGIYLGINASGNTIEGNEIYGQTARAAIVLESSWGTVELPGTSATIRSIGYDAENNPNWSTRDSVDNNIKNNIIDISIARPSIVLISRNDDDVVRSVKGTVITGNRVPDGSQSNVYVQFIQKDAAGIVGTVMNGNVYPAGSAAGKFILGSAVNYARLEKEAGRPEVGFES